MTSHFEEMKYCSWTVWSCPPPFHRRRKRLPSSFAPPVFDSPNRPLYSQSVSLLLDPFRDRKSALLESRASNPFVGKHHRRERNGGESGGEIFIYRSPRGEREGARGGRERKSNQGLELERRGESKKIIRPFRFRPQLQRRATGVT